jgi:mycothiol synthase
MNQTATRLRNYQPVDFDRYVLLQVEVEKLEPMGRCVSRQFIAERLKRPNYCPEQDLFVAEVDKGIAGYMNIEPELAIGRVILDCAVHPEYRRRGLATQLFNCVMNRAKELGAKAAHVNVAENNTVARTVLPGLGFSLVRRFLELRLDIGRVDGSGIGLAKDCCHLRPGEEDRLTKLQNRAFASTWGYNPNTVEEIRFRVSSGNCSWQDIVLIRQGDKAIGYCWIGISCEKGMPSGKKGRILMLGVDPDYRGKGIGRESVMAGLARLRSKGLEIAELTVDSQNKAACGLYQSIGFEVQANTLWYEKVIS